MTSFAVIGTGAIGGFYGAKLAQAGNPVEFLFRKDAELVAARGLHVVSRTEEDIHIDAPSTHSSWVTIPQVDVVLVSTKATANADIAPRLGQIVKPGGIVLVIQNGLGAEALFAEHVDPSVLVVGAAAYIASTKLDANTIEHFDLGMLTIAGYADGYAAAGITAELEALAATLTEAGILVTIEVDLLASRYGKLLWNAPFNALSVILNATTSELINTPSIVELVKTVMNELRAAAAADGREIPGEIVDMLIAGTFNMKPYSTSMKVDYDNGRPLEHEALLGEALKRGAATNTSMPATETLYRQLQFLTP